MNRFLEAPLVKSLFFVLIICFSACKKEQFDHSRFKSVDVIRTIGTETFRDSSISLAIKYDKNLISLKNYPIDLVFTIKNETKTVRYIRPPIIDEYFGNPFFTITTQNGDTLKPNNAEPYGRRFDLHFIRLDSEDSISCRVRIHLHYDFKNGVKYTISSRYYSRSALIKDGLQEVESRGGYCESNTLLFEY